MKRTIARCTVLALMLVTVIACGKKETPEQQLERLRFAHEIIPVGTTTLHADTDPTLMVDLQVVNQGTEVLPQLTVLLKVIGADGSERLNQRVTLDLADVRPGVGERRSALVSGYSLEEGDQVSVELESNLPAEELHKLPEWSHVAAAS